MVKILLNNGADINKKTNEMKTPFDIAQENKHQDIVKLITAHLNKTPNKTAKAIFGSDILENDRQK